VDFLPVRSAEGDFGRLNLSGQDHGWRGATRALEGLSWPPAALSAHEEFLRDEGLNYVFEQYGMPEFRLQEAARCPAACADLVLPHEAEHSASPL
jgi:hypothetical protein